MPAGFYKLKVDKIKRETDDSVSIRFLVPPPLKSSFTYKAGQYLTFHSMINGEDVRRSYSVCSSPFMDDMPTVAVKQVPNGRMSTFMNRDLMEGDLIDAMPPMGKFIVEPDAGNTKHYVLFGGGSGITPLFSIALTVLQQEPNSKVTLVYANRNEQSIIFHNDLNQLEADYAGRLKVVHILETGSDSWTGLTGMLSEPKVKQLLNMQLGADQNSAEYFICGPNGLMQLVESSLENIGIAREQIHLEYFTAIEKKSNSVDEITDEEDEGGDKQVKVELFGDEEIITVSPDKTILEAAQDAGMDPPYSCTVGVCTTCRAKVHKGKVRMDEREGLSDAEIEEGYVLTCQAHPVSKDVELSFE
ncbi:MAG: ferredoxin--NADP reductase [Bacteroidia bacterium]|nr:ferredoxin--NADP reductase [Bacteroidia bacterium]